VLLILYEFLKMKRFLTLNIFFAKVAISFLLIKEIMALEFKIF